MSDFRPCPTRDRGNVRLVLRRELAAANAQAEKLAGLLRSGVEYRCAPRGPHEEIYYQEVDAALAAYDATKGTK